MKKITSTCLVLLGMLSGYTNYAQGFLDKIKEGAGNSLGVSLVGAAKVSAKDQKKADEDAANPLLDGKSITKDKYGLSGVYYSSEVMFVQTKGGKKIPVKKMLFQYDDNSTYLSANTQYAYANDETKVEPMIWGRDSYPKEFVLKVTQAFKQPSYYDRKGNSDLYEYIGTTEQYVDGEYKASKPALMTLKDADLTLIEPGILLCGQNPYKMLVNRVEKDQAYWDRAKFYKLFVFYTADKKEKALAFTQDKLHQLAKEHAQAFKARMDKRVDGQDKIDEEYNRANTHLSKSSSSSSSGSSSGRIKITITNKTDAKIDFTAKGYSSYINPRTTKTIDVGVGLMKASNGWSMDLTKSHDGQTFIIAQ